MAKDKKIKDADAPKSEILAVYFKSLTLENVKCFKDKNTIDLSDGDDKPAMWTVILENNNTGKTTILKCLAGMEGKEWRMQFVDKNNFDSPKNAKKSKDKAEFQFETDVKFPIAAKDVNSEFEWFANLDKENKKILCDFYSKIETGINTYLFNRRK